MDYVSSGIASFKLLLLRYGVTIVISNIFNLSGFPPAVHLLASLKYTRGFYIVICSPLANFFGGGGKFLKKSVLSLLF